MYRLLIAEDEPMLRDVVKDYFEKKGYAVTTAADGLAAIDIIEDEDFDIAVLDVVMPGADGFQVCRALRRRSDIPVIFLTARTAEEDQLRGFEVKADDYVTKPFSLPVLFARAEVLIGRYKGRKEDDLLEAEGLMVDPAGRIVKVDGEAVEMPPKVLDLLIFFMENRGRILTRDQILDHVWGDGSMIYDRAVDTTVKRLRRLLGKRAGYVHTIIKVGYRFEEE